MAINPALRKLVTSAAEKHGSQSEETKQATGIIFGCDDPSEDDGVYRRYMLGIDIERIIEDAATGPAVHVDEVVERIICAVEARLGETVWEAA